MNTNNTTLSNLPIDLKAMVLEFLPLPDLINMQYTTKDFFLILKNNTKLWAKYLFLQCLDLLSEDELIYESDLQKDRLPLNEDKINYGYMANSKRILSDHFLLKQKFQKMFDEFLLPKQAKKLVSYFFETFQRPISPAPCLKRDCQVFPTPSAFQNFLTEIHFGVLPNIFVTDRIQAMVGNLINSIKSSSNNVLIDTDQLLALRWYSFDIFENNTTDQEGGLIEEFYALIYGLISNHCKAVYICLNAVKIDSDLMREYVRHWNGFIYTTIDLNQVLLPFSQYFSEIYSSTCEELPGIPDFSIWRIMVKVWNQNVFSPLAERLQEAFKKMTDNVRSLNGLAELSETSQNMDKNYLSNTENEVSPYDSEQKREETLINFMGPCRKYFT